MELKPVGRIDPRFVEQLIRGICHDVGAPTRHMVQFTKMLNEDVNDGALTEKHKRWLTFIHDGGQQIQEMLSALSVLARLSVVRDIETIELNAVFAQVFEIYSSQVLGSHKEINLQLTGSWPCIEGVKEHWHTLFSCLLSNALKFQEQDVRFIELKVVCEWTDIELQFSIEDNGVGVSENQYNEIIRPFKCLHPKDDYTGIGMGLTYCHYIAEINGATLTFSPSMLGGLKVTYKQGTNKLSFANG